MAKSPTIVFYEIPSLICRLIFEFENSKISIRKEAEVKLQPSATSLIHVWQSWREKLKIAHCTRTGNSLLPPSVVRLLLVRPVIQEQSWTLLGQVCKTWVNLPNTRLHWSVQPSGPSSGSSTSTVESELNNSFQIPQGQPSQRGSFLNSTTAICPVRIRANSLLHAKGNVL